MMDITPNNCVGSKDDSGNFCAFATTVSENFHSPAALTCAMSVGDKRKRNEYGGAEIEEETVQQSSSISGGTKFNDFDKLREEAKFKVGQTWALYDSVDGMPRLYAQIRKVSVPSFKLRINYLKPDPDHENDILWFKEELPISVGKFRLGKTKDIKERSLFSHRVKCNDRCSPGHITVSPRLGETWALFKDWDINWSKKPDSHRKYEYEFVVVLSDYPEGDGVSVAYLHKAKGFASLFFRKETGPHGWADRFCISSQCLYRFSHRIPSFEMTGLEGKGVPKDAYELDQAALPEAIEEISIPLYLFPKPKPKAFGFPLGGKVIQTGQIWAFYNYDDNLPRHYCRIQKVSFTQAFGEASVFKLHVRALIATKFPENVIQWEDKGMPVCCGTFSVKKVNQVLDNVSLLSHQIEPHTSMDGNELTILPKIGEVWATYRFWNCEDMVSKLVYLDYDVVLVLDDTLDYKVLALEVFFTEDEENTVFRAAESRLPCCDEADGPEVIFTIPKSKLLRFSHQVPASRITKEIDGDVQEMFKVDPRALPSNVKL